MLWRSFFCFLLLLFFFKKKGLGHRSQARLVGLFESGKERGDKAEK